MMFLIHFFFSYSREKFLKILDIFLQTKDSDNAKSIPIAEWQEIFGIITDDAHQLWTDSCDSHSEYLIIFFDYLIIPFDNLIIGQNKANFYLQWKRDFYSWKPFL